jgi:hypothetical protein
MPLPTVGHVSTRSTPRFEGGDARQSVLTNDGPRPAALRCSSPESPSEGSDRAAA